MGKLLFTVMALTMSGWVNAAGTTIPGGNLSLSQTQWSTNIGGAANANTVSGGPGASASTAVSAGVSASMLGVETYAVSNATTSAETSIWSTGAGSSNMSTSASTEHYGLAESSDAGGSGAGAIGFGGFSGW